jgi:hypothetical protein
MKIIDAIYFVLTTTFFVLYWTLVWSWTDVEPYGIIGAGIAANGAFFANLIHFLIEANARHKAYHGTNLKIVEKTWLRRWF